MPNSCITFIMLFNFITAHLHGHEKTIHLIILFGGFSFYDASAFMMASRDDHFYAKLELLERNSFARE